MTFTSIEFLLFLPVVFLLHHFVGNRYRWLLLLVASCGFYAALKVPYLLGVLAFVTVFTYGCGIGIQRVTQEGRKQQILWFGVGGNVLALIVMKYQPFLADNLNNLGELLGFVGHLNGMTLVSIGVSFFVFQAIGYLFDIFLEIQEPEHHFGFFALSMAFFPKLLQGPIERSGELLQQLKTPYEFNYDNVRSGIILFLWGFFKKVVVADRLGLFVDAVYGNLHSYSGISLVMATWLYALQLYFDFSAYTNMALGTARLFNIRLTQNFNSPYLAISVADFWRRWHISFSRWVLDYIFKPLQMRWRGWGTHGTTTALIITFLISGIWHGATWGFVVWGALHGLYLSGSVYWKPYQKRIYKLLGIEKSRMLKVWQTFITFQLVCFSWIFFRSENLTDAWYIVSHIFSADWSVPLEETADFLLKNVAMGQNPREFQVTVVVLLFSALAGIIKKHTKSQDVTDVFRERPLIIRWTMYYGLVSAIIMLGIFENGRFLYNQF